MASDLSSLGQAALQLSECGFAVFPCKSRRKEPLTKHGFKDATRNPEQICAWWAGCPDANIGIATGAASGIVVVDIDGEAGEAQLASLTAIHGALPATSGVTTGKGRHLYFALPGESAEIPCSAGGGVDIRGDGGHVVTAPSIHPSGAEYAWFGQTEDGDFAEAPAWLLEFARNRKAYMGAGGTKRAAYSRKRERKPGRAAGDSAGLHAVLSNVAAPTAPPSEALEAPRLISALATIPADEREVWLKVGMALYETGWPRGRAAWGAWSQTAPDKFNEAGQDKAWASFARPYSGPRVTLATIYALAKERKWTDPTSPLAAIAGTEGAAAPPAAGIEAAPLITPDAEINFARFVRTDAGNGEAFLAVYGENVRYVEAWGSWLVWNGSRWVESTALAMLPHAVHVARLMALWAAQKLSGEAREAWMKHALATEKERGLHAMLKLASSRAILRPHALDSDPWLLGCPNGTLDLRTGELREARREDFITKRISVPYDPAAECPQWLEFLGWALKEDPDLIAFVQRLAGYTLTGEVREETLAVFIGCGENGKTTLLETLLALMGEYGGKASSDLLLHAQGKDGAPSPDVAALHGKRLVVVSETEDGGRLSEARVKAIVSNGKISARRLYREPFDFAPTHTLILETNYRPRVHGTDHGIWRRLAPLVFGATFGPGEKITNYRERFLLPELPGILNWVVSGCVAWRRDGLRLPIAVQAAAAEYRSNEDQVGQWAEERVESNPASVVPFDKLHSDYAAYLGPHGRPFGRQRFAEELDRLGFPSIKLTGGKRARRGLRLKPVEIAPGLPADPAQSLSAKLKVVK